MRSAFVVLAVLAVAAPARAGDEVVVTERDLVEPAPWGEREGRAVVLLDARFRDFFGGELEVAGVPRARLPIDPGRSELAADLARFRTRTGPLRKGRSNVRVQGVARDGERGRELVVTDVTLRPGDVVLFSERANLLAPGDASGRSALAAEARRRAERFAEDDLREWARALDLSALDIERSRLGRQDVEGAIALARRYRDVAGVVSAAITLLGSVADDPAVGTADRERVAGVLEDELAARRHRGRWVSEADRRAALGFVARTGPGGHTEWVRAERIELEAAAGRARTAARAPVSAGLSKEEVARTRGYGFPVFVDRLQDRGHVIDQWILADGRRLYFEDGFLFEACPAR